MATAKPKAGDVAPLVPVTLPDDGLAKFTWNIRGFNESLTIRCDSEEELKTLRDRWSQVINPPRRKIPYMHEADSCLVAECGGVMVKRTGTNRRTQKPYNYLRCSKNPTCQFFAYIENEQNTPEQDNGEAGTPAVGATPKEALQNGGAHEPATAQQAAGSSASA